jgi:Peptidase A4 family
MTFLVQETSGSSTSGSLTLTFGSAATVGNGIIIAVSGFAGSTISGITIGGTGSLFTEIGATGSTTYNAQIWACATGSVASPTIVISAGASGIIAYAYEVQGTITPDQNEWSWNPTGTTWSSATTGSTLPVQEFVVAIGATYGTSNTTIAATASGWTNETAIDSVHVGSDYYAAVSGYQQQGYSTATYDYSGTMSGSTGWGAITATFVPMSTQTGWGGVVFTDHSSYTGISATFTIPTLSGESGSLASVWVGLGNVYQTGIYLSYNTSSSGNASTSPWSWWISGSGELWNTTSYPTKAGDQLRLAIQLTSTNWLMTIANNTEGWSYTETKSVLAVNIGSIQNSGAGPATWIYPVSQAEIIIEKEGSDTLPDYGSITFSSITTTPSIVNAPSGLLTVNTNIDQYPGQFNLSTGSFVMNWKNYS